MTEPTPPPLAAPRFFMGWVFVAVLFGLLILGSVMDLVVPSAGPPATGNLELETRIAFLTKRISADLEDLSPSSAAASSPKTGFETLEASAVKAGLKDPRVAKFALIAGYEVRGKPSSAAIQGVKTSKSELDIQIAKAYEAKKASPELLEKTAAWSTTGKFLDKVIAAQLKDMAGDSARRDNLVSASEAWTLMIFGGIAMLGLGLGLVLLAAGIVTHFTQKWSTKTLWRPTASLIDADRYAYRMAFFLMIFIVTPLFFLAVRAILPKNLPGDVAMAMNAVTFTTVLIATVLFLRVRVNGRADSWSSVLGRTERPWELVGLGVAGFLANLPILAVLLGVVSLVKEFLPTPSHPLSESLSQGSTVLGLFLSFFLAAVLAPLVEELTFRGLLMPALEKVLKSPVFAILLQGLLFAVIHPQGPAAWPMLMSIGCMAGFLAWKSGSLIPAIVMHAVHNAAILTMITIVT